MERAPIELDSFHHIYNRGTDKRTVFVGTEDYKRFILYLNILNDTEIESPTKTEAIKEEPRGKPTERLVNLVAFCLMPNHFHLLLQERIAGGISKFMQRLSTAYTMYFNEKNERSGALFQGRFKSKFIDKEAYLIKIIDYIHLNPKEPRIHEWSSYHYYCGQNNFSYLLQTETFKELSGIIIGEDYRGWLASQGDNFDEIGHLSIDTKDKIPK